MSIIYAAIHQERLKSMAVVNLRINYLRVSIRVYGYTIITKISILKVIIVSVFLLIYLFERMLKCIYNNDKARRLEGTAAGSGRVGAVHPRHGATAKAL